MKFKIMNEGDKIVRKAALKYFNTFESLRIRKDQRAESFEPVLNSADSGHIAHPSSVKSKRPKTAFDMVKGVTNTSFYPMSPDQ